MVTHDHSPWSQAGFRPCVPDAPGPWAPDDRFSSRLARQVGIGPWIPSELAFLFGLAYLDKSQTLVEPAGNWVVFLDTEAEGNADRHGLCLEVLDDGSAYAMALNIGKQLNAAQLDVVGGAGNPQSADALVIDLDHAGRAVGNLAPDLLHRPLTEALAPLPFVEVIRKAVLSPCGLNDHVGEKPDVFGSSWPYVVTEHRGMLSLLIVGRLTNFWCPGGGCQHAVVPDPCPIG